MATIEFHKRSVEKNVRKIRLMYKSNCIKIIDFSGYQLIRVLYDVGKMLARGDSKETIADYALPYINLHSFEEELNLDDLISDDSGGIDNLKKLLESKEKENSKQAATIAQLEKENEKFKKLDNQLFKLTKEKEELQVKLDKKNERIKMLKDDQKSKNKSVDIDIEKILEEGLS